MERLPKEYAEYGKAKSGGDRCMACRWFDAPAACEIVEGKIERDGWCRFWHEKKARQSTDEAREYVRRMRGK